MSRLLVAGATGYLGRHVVAVLKQRGHWVRALARTPEKLSQPGLFLEPRVGDQVDEIFHAEATRPETLDGLCDGIDFVISSLGITRQSDKVTFRDVDYQANRNVLDRALQAKVRKFVFVSVFAPERLPEISMIRAREDLVKDLRNSEIDHAVIRPTGFFSDASEFFHMARSGRVWMIGDGASRLNPIHGADVALLCADALETADTVVEAGGPDTFTGRELAELAFAVVGAKPKVTGVPVWMIDLTLNCVKPFSARYYDLGRFFRAVSTTDFVAPVRGSRRLEAFYRELLRRESEQ